MKPSGPGILFVGRFLIIVLISVLVIHIVHSHFLRLPGSLAVLASSPVKRSYIEKAVGCLLLTKVERL